MHRSIAELETHLEHIAGSPSDHGVVELIAVRPAKGERIVVSQAALDRDLGVVGDSWKDRGRGKGEGYELTQVTVMNSRVADAVAVSSDRWALAGDQIYADLDLSVANLPPGSRLAVGDAVLEVAAPPHTACKQFAERYGADAVRFVNLGLGRERRFRGMNTFVVEPGAFSVGDRVTKV